MHQFTFAARYSVLIALLMLFFPIKSSFSVTVEQASNTIGHMDEEVAIVSNTMNIRTWNKKVLENYNDYWALKLKSFDKHHGLRLPMPYSDETLDALEKLIFKNKLPHRVSTESYIALIDFAYLSNDIKLVACLDKIFVSKENSFNGLLLERAELYDNRSMMIKALSRTHLDEPAYESLKAKYLGRLEAAMLRKVTPHSPQELYSFFLAYFTLFRTVFLEGMLKNTEERKNLKGISDAGYDVAHEAPEVLLRAWDQAFLAVHKSPLCDELSKQIHHSPNQELLGLLLLSEDKYLDGLFMASYNASLKYLNKANDFKHTNSSLMEYIASKMWARKDLPEVFVPVTLDRSHWELRSYQCKLSHEEIAQDPYVRSLQMLLLHANNPTKAAH